MKKLAVVVIAVLLAACGGGKSKPAAPKIPKSFNFVADVRLNGASNVRGTTTSCVGAGPFADVKGGAPVTVTNAAGKQLGAGSVHFGIGTDVYKQVLDQCTFRYVVNDVPRSKHYTVTIASRHATPVRLAFVVQSGGRLTYSLNGELIVPPATGFGAQ